ncbi:hypothetical protein J2Z23_004157 [Lederbergia galactosidilyticus]|uniref:hypothetical protein n=1 Tax=Lederbergia galactosidilytica TaxID=217031 RepID=UPI001AE98D9E|nr:hypothetical protein [Lederbergia galactosidilytica]MBP1917172.1 hypothetical protein [Lederbergia galactosidilytica]
MIKLNVTTHSGADDIVEVESYNAAEMAEQLNNNELQAIAIGDNVYSRIDLKNIKPVYEEDVDNENE